MFDMQVLLFCIYMFAINTVQQWEIYLLARYPESLWCLPHTTPMKHTEALGVSDGSGYSTVQLKAAAGCGQKMIQSWSLRPTCHVVVMFRPIPHPVQYVWNRLANSWLESLNRDIFSATPRIMAPLDLLHTGMLAGGVWLINAAEVHPLLFDWSF